MSENSDNPFTAKVERRKNNPFSARAQAIRAARKQERASKLAELDTLIAETVENYSISLDNALKKGITRAQINRLFNVSDRHMHALISLGKQRERLLNGQPERKK